jgi:hypothetical protein
MQQLFENTEESQAKLTRILQETEVLIRFVKQDATIRDMKATLSESVIDYEPKGGRERSLAIRTVWDLKAKAWRSFRWDSLMSYEILNAV